MDARGLIRPTLIALAVAAAGSAGCVGPDAFRFPRPYPVGKSYGPAPDNPAPAVVQTGGTAQPPAALPPVPPLPVPPTAPPGGGPAAPGPPGASGPPPGSVTPAVPGPWTGGAVGFGPNERNSPTAVGSLGQLGPNDNPLDRMIGLAKMAEAARAENAALIGRIRELEGSGLTREQALAEALRMVDAATAEVALARADMARLREELRALRQRLEDIEREDVADLKAVIQALDRLLTTPGRLP